MYNIKLSFILPTSVEVNSDPYVCMSYLTIEYVPYFPWKTVHKL